MSEVTIDYLETSDGNPSVAPWRLSNRPGNHVEMRWTPRLDEGTDTLRAWRLMFEGTSRLTGKKVRSGGLVCGVDRCGPQAQSLVLENFSQVTTTYTYGDLGPAVDGDHQVNLYAASDAEGWI